MIIDMHIHTMVSSPCSLLDPEECVLYAMEKKLDAICITEHETHEGAFVVKEIGRQHGLKVFAGMEVTSREGHILIYGCGNDIKGVLPAADIAALVSSAGGIAIPAHPWRGAFGWYSGSLDRDLADTDFRTLFPVIEMYNGQCTANQNRRGMEYCEKTGVYGIGGSDAHMLSQIGDAVTEFEDDIADEKELVAALLSGRYKAVLNKN